MSPKIQIKLLEGAMLPTRGTKYSAGIDFYSPIYTVVPARGKVLIMTGVELAWDDPTFYLQLMSRSGLANKKSITVEGGVIDFDYRQNIGVILYNHSFDDFPVDKGDRIAQGIFLKIMENTEMTLTDEFDPIVSDRVGGFGSTGTA